MGKVSVLFQPPSQQHTYTFLITFLSDNLSLHLFFSLKINKFR